MKRKKRAQTGRYITQNSLPKENPTLEEVIVGQVNYDVRLIRDNENNSPYWNWMEKHKQRAEDGYVLESPPANPDVLAERIQQIAPSVQIPAKLLTIKQLEIMRTYLDGRTQVEIAQSLSTSRGYINRVIKISTKKLQKYFKTDGYF